MDEEHPGAQPDRTPKTEAAAVLMFQFRWTAEYAASAYCRKLQASRTRKYETAGRVALSAAILFLAVVVPYTERWTGWGKPLFWTSVLGVALILLWSGRLLELLLLRSGTRHSESAGDVLHFSLTEDALYVDNSTEGCSIAWKRFESAVRCEDGYLLHLADESGTSYWLPSRALVAGTLEEVEELLSRKLKVFRSLTSFDEMPRPDQDRL